MNLREFFLNSAWWGKCLGAFFGFLVAGPIGALVGVFIGNFFDRGFASHLSSPLWFYHSERNKNAKEVFFEATFLFLGHIAKADGRVSEKEIQMAQQIMKELRLNHKEKIRAKDLFKQGKSSYFAQEAVLLRLFQSCYASVDLLKLFVNVQYRAAQVDGLSAKKIELLNVILNRLGFAPLTRQKRFFDDFSYSSAWYSEEPGVGGREQRSQYAESPSSAYTILGVKEGSTHLEVKKAYRKLISQNHPDKLIAKGMSEAAIRAANEKTQTIRKAYESICTRKGWKF